MRAVLGCAVLLGELMLVPWMSAEPLDDAQSDSTICAFEDGKQITGTLQRHRHRPVRMGLLPEGIDARRFGYRFFTETDLVLGDATIPTGGYTMYVIPGKKWMLHRKQKYCN